MNNGGHLTAMQYQNSHDSREERNGCVAKRRKLEKGVM